MNIRSILFSTLLLALSANGFAQKHFTTIRTRIHEEIQQNTSDKKWVLALPKLQSEQQPNGSWKDINYTDASATNWAPGEHLVRVKTLATAFSKEGSAFFNSKSLYETIVSALRFWYEADPKSGNWWHNEIASPQTLGEILVLLQDVETPLPKDLRLLLIDRMKRGNPYDKTGANKLDIAIHYLYRACVTANKALMDSAVEQAFQPIMFTTEEGLQHDYSYQQHGPQLQISSYGLVFLIGEYRIASLLRETPYALPQSKQALLENYLVRTFIPAIRGRYIDFNTEGRGISRLNILDKTRLTGKNGLLSQAVSLTSANRKCLEAAVKRMAGEKPASFGVTPLHNYFWKADYTQHIRPAYNFNVRTISVRTKRTESGNRENLLGTFLSDGSTNIQRRGGEYFNIMPVWEWDKIPGTTGRDYTTDQPMTAEWGESGSTSFVGGVSDSLYGLTAHTMHYTDVLAKKSWFFFDDEVVCLGAGINSKAAENVVTTINQCWLNGEVSLLSGGNLQTLNDASFTGAADGVWHDSIGYFFPEAQQVQLSRQVQKGKWSLINAKSSDKEISGEVFKLWMGHGAKPQNASYSYIVVPGIAAKEMKPERVKDIQIVRNDNVVQAVHQKALRLTQVVFYMANKLEVNDWTMEVNQPCALQLKEEKGRVVLHLSDPSQEQKTVTVSLKNRAGLSTSIQCQLPQGNAKGATVRYELMLK